MSIVINLLFEDCSFLVGDSRSSHVDKSGTTQVISDKSRKIFELSDYTAVGFAGHYKSALTLLQRFHNRTNNSKLVYCDEVALDFAQDAVAFFPSDSRPNLRFVVTGQDSKGKIASYVLESYHNFLPQKVTASKGDNPLIVIGPDCIDLLTKKFTKIIGATGLSTKNIHARLLQCVNSAAVLDRSIGGEMMFIVRPLQWLLAHSQEPQ